MDPLRSAEPGGPRGTMRQESVATVREWAARLSHPSVELLVLDDHVVVQEDGELIASGRLLALDHHRPSEHTE